jgi:hypothetical protein
VIAKQRLACVLKAKGHHYQFVYAKNAGQVGRKVISQSLPQALEYVWQDYPISGKQPVIGIRAIDVIPAMITRLYRCTLCIHSLLLN